jgi:hypothetical protein
MANQKNSNRHKRKYGSREAATARNKEKRQKRHEARTERLVERAQKLLGRKVVARTKDGPVEGKIREVLRPGDAGYPTDRKRGGTYFVVGDIADVVARSRVKVC